MFLTGEKNVVQELDVRPNSLDDMISFLEIEKLRGTVKYNNNQFQVLQLLNIFEKLLINISSLITMEQ